MEKSETLSVFLMIVLLAFAVVLVDERMLRTAVAVLPALMLAQKALQPKQTQAPVTGAAVNRRQDDEVRAYIEQLLKYFREFYTTCHLMSVNVLSVEAAEERAALLERELNQLMAQVTETARKRGASPPPPKR